MRLPAAALLTASLLSPALFPAVAHAGRFTVGVALGRTQTETDAKNDFDASSTAGLWVRANLGHRISTDFQLGKISTDNENARVRTLDVTGRVAVANLRHGTVHPLLLVTLGLDSTATDTSYHHSELGLGVEADLARDFVLGFDLRTGDRTADARPVDDNVPINARLPSYLSEGSYRSARLYLGVRL